MDAAVIERRREPRYHRDSLGPLRGRVRPGHEIVIVDVSSGGALIEVTSPLGPGARVHVHLKTFASEAALVARVTRCGVAAVSEGHITYRAALQFDHPCEWVREALTRNEYEVPDSPLIGSAGSASAGTTLPAHGAPLEAEPLK
jgi:hypothetical protein